MLKIHGFIWLVVLSVFGACNAHAQAVTLDCTTRPCVATGTWTPPDLSLTGCNLYIDALPAISGTVVTDKTTCSATMPKLLTGAYSLNMAGVNAFGVGAKMPAPLGLTTGTPPGAPSRLVVQ